jgi:hypothetical protein
MKIPFWGCPVLNFMANLPFHVMRHAASSAERPAYAAFEKEIPMALQSTVGFFKKLNCYQNLKRATNKSKCEQVIFDELVKSH